ncbi:uncharacterized protein PHALS_05437 [Plasmopara halstedii]|uniref:Uncharacterized protein n=1 Tax=Plasmopara halstedii TaxID=4781 RepID=A0A0N7L446_PLAHL|nr:uncharacterized protein PHALS_05437 [Plasmopara halstedii]CEG37659.1 hypothetical protein PHALS_05437 [Plasmopara halstedii]|eukprot:XP_024574028.1 hypothetical protein PHALS_05437 [Plasmopara halstedii]
MALKSIKYVHGRPIDRLKYKGNAFSTWVHKSSRQAFVHSCAEHVKSNLNTHIKPFQAVHKLIRLDKPSYDMSKFELGADSMPFWNTFLDSTICSHGTTPQRCS